MAGSFYPAQAKVLRGAIHQYLDGARASSALTGKPPKALIVPHAGLVYSGPVAAHGYVLLEGVVERISRVVLLGPSHHVPFPGLAVAAHDAFETPLGRVPVDESCRQRLLRLPFVHALDEAHRWEHSLEVQLPFLQEVLRGFTLTPIAVGQATPEQVAEVLDSCWGSDETLIVVSSDLSHYFDYETAKRMDAATARAIEALDAPRIQHDDACGRIAVQGLLEMARRHSLTATTVDLRNSGDTAGSRDEVVGYGTWAFR
ncbi:MAG: AmmeMemoRadiSam system protein B [Myxococcales bacterium]|nr:AmmeMemoRadiSam system protein B [Myxococcales bacterium]MDH3483262.1 AmmeMemoRadiSam system protein B [Myxococcales bacterium]